MHPGIFPQKITEVVKTEDTFLTGKMSHMTLPEGLDQTINKHTIINLTQIVIEVITVTSIAEILSRCSVAFTTTENKNTQN